MKILVTGAAGMLGRDVMLAAGNAGHEVIGYGHAELDIVDAGATSAKIEAERPGVVINCAAWTDVDGAEEHEDEATRVNGAGAVDPGRLVLMLLGLSLIHISEPT